MFGRLIKGGHVKVRVEAGKLAFDITPNDVTPPSPDEGDRSAEQDAEVTS